MTARSKNTKPTAKSGKVPVSQTLLDTVCACMAAGDQALAHELLEHNAAHHRSPNTVSSAESFLAMRQAMGLEIRGTGMRLRDGVVLEFGITGGSLPRRADRQAPQQARAMREAMGLERTRSTVTKTPYRLVLG
jgi:hypothetical protein